MNQDMSAGLGAGLMNLGSMFSQMLMKRMDSKWEDEQYEKRLAAAQKAEMAKLKALDEYNATRQAGAVPFMPKSDEGPMQPMMQPVNAMGSAIGSPRAMQAHEQYNFEAGQGKARADAAKAELDILDTQAGINLKQSSAKANESLVGYRDAAKNKLTNSGIGAPKGKGGSNSTALNSTLKDARALITQLEEPQLSRYKQALASEISSINSGLTDADDSITGLLLLMSNYTPGKQPVVK